MRIIAQVTAVQAAWRTALDRTRIARRIRPTLAATNKTRRDESIKMPNIAPLHSGNIDPLSDVRGRHTGGCVYLRRLWPTAHF